MSSYCGFISRVIITVISILIIHSVDYGITPDYFPEPLGTLKRPNRGIPVIQKIGEPIIIESTAPALLAKNWAAEIITKEGKEVQLSNIDAVYGLIKNGTEPGWLIEAVIPVDAPEALYDLTVSYDVGSNQITETNERSVKVVKEIKSNFYWIHLTDTHLFYDGFKDTLTKEVIRQVNLINPEYVVITGDIGHFLPCAARIDYLLREFEVPVYCIIGNHDWGHLSHGWVPTDPIQFWRDYYWQTYYSFDYGNVHNSCFQYCWCGVFDDCFIPQVDRDQFNWAEHDFEDHIGMLQIGFAHRIGHRDWCDGDGDRLHELLYDNGQDPAIACFYGHVNDDEWIGDWYDPKRLSAMHSNHGHPAHGYTLVRMPIDTSKPNASIPEMKTEHLKYRIAHPNDGSSHTNAAVINNRKRKATYENGLVKFIMPQVPEGYTACEGDLFQSVDINSKTICYVHKNIAAPNIFGVMKPSYITIKPKNSTPPLAAITSHFPGDSTGLSVAIYGFAAGGNTMFSPDLMAGKGFDPIDWQDTQNVARTEWDNPESLGSFTFNNYDKGPWTIKLTVLGEGDIVSEDRVIIHVEKQAFENIAVSSGVAGLENSLAGTAGDFDNSEGLDLFVVNWGTVAGLGHANLLFRNNGNGGFDNVTSSSFPDGYAGCWGKTAFFFDYDNDEDSDLYVINNNTDFMYSTIGCPDHAGANMFYENLGDGTFDDITSIVDLGDDKYALGGTVFDYDNDGYLDILLVNNDLPVLYRNRGTGQAFENVDLGSVFYPKPPQTGFYTDAAVGDFNNDGYSDIYFTKTRKWSINNEETTCPEVTQNILYAGDGEGGFTDVTDNTSVACDIFNIPWRNLPDPCTEDEYFSSYSKSAAWGDYDNDGDLDLLVINFQDQFLDKYDSGAHCVILTEPLGNILYRNKGDGEFEDVTEPVGISVRNWSLGGDFFDFDNDGDLDIFISSEEGNFLYLNKGGTFTDISNCSGLRDLDILNDNPNDPSLHPGLNKHCVIGDFTGDNVLDIFQPRGKLSNRFPNALFKNNVNALLANNWLKVKTIGHNSNKLGIGARIKITCSNETEQIREVSIGNGSMQREAAVYFGLGQNTVDQLEVIWPSGQIQIVPDEQIYENEIFVAREPPE